VSRVRVSVFGFQLPKCLPDTRNLKPYRQSPHPDNPPMGISTKLSYERTLFAYETALLRIRKRMKECKRKQ
jgi:hypothetical protein